MLSNTTAAFFWLSQTNTLIDFLNKEILSTELSGKVTKLTKNPHTVNSNQVAQKMGINKDIIYISVGDSESMTTYGNRFLPGKMGIAIPRKELENEDQLKLNLFKRLAHLKNFDSFWIDLVPSFLSIIAAKTLSSKQPIYSYVIGISVHLGLSKIASIWRDSEAHREAIKHLDEETKNNLNIPSMEEPSSEKYWRYIRQPMIIFKLVISRIENIFPRNSWS